MLPDDTAEADSASDSASIRRPIRRSDSAPDSASEPEPRGAPILAVVSIDAEKENVDPETCPKAAAIAAVDALDAAVHAAIAARAAVAAAVDGGETMRDVDAKLRSLTALLARVSRDDEADERPASADADAQTDGGGDRRRRTGEYRVETVGNDARRRVAEDCGYGNARGKGGRGAISEETAREGVRQGATEGAIRDAVEEARPDAVEEARRDVSEDGPLAAPSRRNPSRRESSRSRRTRTKERVVFPSANDSRVSVAVDARQHVRVRLAGTGAEGEGGDGDAPSTRRTVGRRKTSAPWRASWSGASRRTANV